MQIKSWNELCDHLLPQYQPSETNVFLICDVLHWYHLYCCCLLSTLKQMTVLSLGASCIKQGPCLATAFAEISCSVCVCVRKTLSGVCLLQELYTAKHWWRESSSFHRNPFHKGSFELFPVSITGSQAGHLLLYFVGVLSVWQERAGRVQCLEGPLLSCCEVVSSNSSCWSECSMCTWGNKSASQDSTWELHSPPWLHNHSSLVKTHHMV